MIHIFKFLLGEYFKSNKKIIISYIILNLILYPVNSIYMPRLYSELISKVSNKKTNDDDYKSNFRILQYLNKYKDKNIESLIFYISIVSIILGIFYRLKYYLYSVIFPKYKMWLRNNLFSKTLDKKNLDFEEQKVGKEIMRLEDLIFTTKEIFNFIVVDMFELVLISILIIGYLYYLNKSIAVYAIIQLFVIAILISFAYSKIKKTTLSKVDSFFHIADNIDNSFNNLSNILINNQIEKEVNKNGKFSTKYKDDAKISLNILNNLSFLIRIVTILTLFFILIKGYKLFSKNVISSVSFTTIVILLLHFQNYLYHQTWSISLFLDRLVQIKYNEEYLTDLLLPNYKSKNLKNVINEGKIEFKNVNYKYKKSNKPIYDNLNLTINGNEKVGIIGKSGSGKSTLIKLLIRFYKLGSGQILIDDIPHKDINIEYLRSKINYVNQSTLLFDENVYYNIKYGNNTKYISNLTIDNILKKYDLYTIFENLEKGLNTQAGPKGTKLSMGMQKITILLRGLMRDSKIIIFDEPLSGLDSKTRIKVIKMIIENTENKTVLVITHDKEIIPYMDRVVNLNDIK